MATGHNKQTACMAQVGTGREQFARNANAMVRHAPLSVYLTPSFISCSATFQVPA
jgi:hypothetical protein